jgi:hypothetical protein
LEIVQDHWQLTKNEEWLHRRVKRHCLSMSSLERTIAHLRSRIKYLKGGDTNTILFRNQAGFRKKKNFIPKLMLEERVVTSHEEKQDIMFDYFSDLLGTSLH